MNAPDAERPELKTVKEAGEPEYFLTPLLANDPLPFLFDGEGNVLDADGGQLEDRPTPVISRLRREALGIEPRRRWLPRLKRSPLLPTQKRP